MYEEKKILLFFIGLVMVSTAGQMDAARYLLSRAEYATCARWARNQFAQHGLDLKLNFKRDPKDNQLLTSYLSPSHPSHSERYEYFKKELEKLEQIEKMEEPFNKN